MATQNTPSSKKDSNPQPKPKFYCEPCRKNFPSKSARRQHLRDSPAHKETQNVASQASSSQVQIKTQNKTENKTRNKPQNQVQNKTQNQAQNQAQSRAQNQPQNPSQKTGKLATAQRLPSQTDGNVLNKSKQKKSDNTAKKETAPKGPWSMYDLAQTPSLYRELSRHCHSVKDLSRNKYEVSTYTAEDIEGLKKCKNCGSTSQSIYLLKPS